jgi:putative FmdB family regulatory protein
MPIYEYLCQSCGKKFEVLQKFSDEPLLIHPDCGGKVDKLISTSALQFKGSGWYVNDYAKGVVTKPGDTKAEGKSDGGAPGSDKSESSKSEGSKSDSGNESKSESKSDAKSDTKSDSKPAASESKPAASSSPAADSK